MKFFGQNSGPTYSTFQLMKGGLPRPSPFPPPSPLLSFDLMWSPFSFSRPTLHGFCAGRGTVSSEKKNPSSSCFLPQQHFQVLYDCKSLSISSHLSFISSLFLIPLKAKGRRVKTRELHLFFARAVREISFLRDCAFGDTLFPSLRYFCNRAKKHSFHLADSKKNFSCLFLIHPSPYFPGPLP